MNKNDFLIIHPEVQQALENNLPIVALESTIISHGMPWPQNAITAKAVEDEVRKYGAVPATIAIKDGKCLVGLSSEDIDYFGQAHDVWKVSLRDMPFVISKKMPGAFIQPSFDFIKEWAKRKNLNVGTTNAEIASNSNVIARIEKEVEKINEKFGNWEKIKRFELTPDIWSIDGGHLTPTLKLKRKIVMEKYKDLYQKIYL